jgi:preprotein translocase subunit SecE
VIASVFIFAVYFAVVDFAFGTAIDRLYSSLTQ